MVDGVAPLPHVLDAVVQCLQKAAVQVGVYRLAQILHAGKIPAGLDIVRQIDDLFQQGRPGFGMQQLQGVPLQVVQPDVILGAQGQLPLHIQLLGAVVEQGGHPGLGLVGPILPGQADGLLLRAQHMGHALGLQIAQGDGPQLVRGQVMQVRMDAVQPPALDIAVRDLYQERKQKDITDPVVFSWYFSARTAGGQEVDAPVTPQLRELVQRLENASSNAKVSCLILRDGQLTLALQTRYVFAGIPPELDMRDIDGIRRWFTASLTGMGGLMDILQESPVLTGAEK